MDNKFNLVDFFNAYKDKKVYEKYSQEANLQDVDKAKWERADVNNDGVLNEDDSKVLDERFEEIGQSKTLYDLNQDDEVKFDDLFAFSEKMDINKDGKVCILEEQLLEGKTADVYAQVKENLENDEKFNLKDLMSYSKAVSDLSDEKKTSLKTEISSLEDTMISKLKTKYGTEYDIDGEGAKGDINDLKSFWKTTAGADQLKLGEDSKLKVFLDETETGLRGNVKAADESMTDAVLDNMKKTIQDEALQEDDCGCGSGTGSTGGTSDTGSTGGTGSAGGSTSTPADDDCGCGSGHVGGTGGSGSTGGTTSTSSKVLEERVNTKSQSYAFISDQLGYSRPQMQLDTIEYDEQGRVTYFEKKWAFNCRHQGDERFTLEYSDTGITVTKETDEGRETTFYEYKSQGGCGGGQGSGDQGGGCGCGDQQGGGQVGGGDQQGGGCGCGDQQGGGHVGGGDQQGGGCGCGDQQGGGHVGGGGHHGGGHVGGGGHHGGGHGGVQNPPVQQTTPSVQVANFGVSGGSGNDIIDQEGNDVNTLGNSGIVNVGDNNLYAQNYTVNTYNTVNNYTTTVNNNTTIIEPTPTAEPTVAPTDAPTVAPTDAPTVAPTDAPTVAPTDAPTVAPTDAPTVAPTVAPTDAPTVAPTIAPTDAPTVAPTIAPTIAPTVAPTDAPTVDPGPGPGGDPEYNLMPLMSVLKNIESFDPDGVLSDLELDIAMKNPGNADMDGNNDEISAEEMAIFNKIQQFNQDKNLIANVMKGDISNIDAATLQELQELSDAIKALRDS